MELTQIEQQKERRTLKSEDRLKNQWGNIYQI